MSLPVASMEQKTLSNKALTLNTLKGIAIIAMLVDHLAWAFVSDDSTLGLIMHFIGKTTAPIMFYAAVEGFHHTKNLRRYLGRLALFALISYFPFIYFSAGGNLTELRFIKLNVIYTILMGLLAITVRRSSLNPVLKTLLVFSLMGLCISSDWGMGGFAIIVVFDFYYGNFQNQAFGYTLLVLFDFGVISLIQSPLFDLVYDGRFVWQWEYMRYSMEYLGMLIPLLLLSFYRGEKGKDSPFSKWFFYIFYPLHLLVLGFLQSVMQKHTIIVFPSSMVLTSLYPHSIL